MGAQTFLSIGAIALFMYTAVQVNRSYVAASAHVVSQQKEIALVNYGQTLSDSLYSVSYSDLVNKQGVRQILGTDTLIYEINIAAEAILIENVEGRICSITLEQISRGDVIQKFEFKVPIPNTAGD